MASAALLGAHTNRTVLFQADTWLLKRLQRTCTEVEHDWLSSVVLIRHGSVVDTLTIVSELSDVAEDDIANTANINARVIPNCKVTAAGRICLTCF